MELCRQLKTEPLIVLPATKRTPEDVKYAMDWVHYLNDPVTTEMGKLRASNGYPQPYNVKYFQIDNEPMNFNIAPEQYAELVNLYGSELRKIDPELKMSHATERSNDLNWSQKLSILPEIILIYWGVIITNMKMRISRQGLSG